MEVIQRYFDFHDAIDYGDIYGVKSFILQNSRYINKIRDCVNMMGKTFVYMAVKNNDHLMVDCLICNDFDFTSSKKSNGNTPLTRAIISGYTSCVDVLLQHGANPNEVYYYNIAPIHLAINYMSSSYDIIELLVKYNANVNALVKSPNGNNYSPLEIDINPSNNEILFECGKRYSPVDDNKRKTPCDTCIIC